jgi:WD40 repeat protein
VNLKISKVATLKGHTGAVYALENANSANKIFSGSVDRIVAEWDLGHPEAGEMAAQVKEPVYCLKMLPGTKYLMAGQAKGGIHIINLPSKKEERLLQYHTGAIFDLAFSEEHDLLFSAGGEGTFAISRLKDLSLIKTIKLSEDKIRSIAVHPLQKEIAIGCGDGTICIYELPSLELKKRWIAHTEKFSVNTVVYNPSGNFLLSGARDAHLNIFDVLNNYMPVTSIPAHNYAIYSIAWSPDQRLFATASRDKTIKIWNAETFEVLARINKEKYDGHLNSVNKLLWTSYNDYLISAGDDRAVMVWKILTD